MEGARKQRLNCDHQSHRDINSPLFLGPNFLHEDSGPEMLSDFSEVTGQRVQRFLTGGNFAPRGHLTMLGDIFDCHEWRVRVSESQGCCQHPPGNQHSNPHGPKCQYCRGGETRGYCKENNVFKLIEIFKSLEGVELSDSSGEKQECRINEGNGGR